MKNVIAPVLLSIGWSSSPAEFLEFWFSRENVVDQRVISIARQLRSRGCRCYLGTNQEKYRLAYLMKVMKFGELFDGVFCSCEIGVLKPDLAFFSHIQETLSCDPGDCHLLDDSKRNILAAESLGWHGIHHQNSSDAIELLKFVEQRPAVSGSISRGIIA